MSQVTPQVSDIVLERSSHLQVSYVDGVDAHFEIDVLRQACPCAACRGRREQGLDATTATSVEAIDAALHGNWGIAITWSDGHDTGIYSWRLLRDWWDGGAAASEGEGADDTRTEEP